METMLNETLGLRSLGYQVEAVLGKVIELQDSLAEDDPADQEAIRILDTIANHLESAVYGLHDFSENTGIYFV
jgi:hypothetical protein